MLVAEIARTSQVVASTRSRLAKVSALATVLKALTPAEAPIAIAWLSGELPQRQIGVGWASLRETPPPSGAETLTVLAADSAFSSMKALSGAGSQNARRGLLDATMAAATAPEQDFLRALLGGGLRQGALAGVMVDAIASASGLPVASVRRAAMLSGDLALVGAAALGGSSLGEFALEVGRPVSPMLAQTASDPADALQRLGGEAVFEWKLDGARVQIHRSGSSVAVFSRTLDDVTARVPDVASFAAGLPAPSFVLDAEVIAVRPDGRPQPFQVTASRFASSKPVDLALHPHVFDLLHLSGDDLIDAPTSARHAALDSVVPASSRVPRLVTSSASDAAEFLDATLGAGHEGVMAKGLGAPYEAGRRGAAWLKIKPVHTLDLVVLGVEWGSGRRRGWLSNIHLGARSENGLVMLGKTFKGMSDEMLKWQTARFLELADGPTDGWVVTLRPEQVVEIAFDGVQRSSQYPGGVALRFARVVRYRDDKTAADADTIETVRAYLPAD